MMRPEVLDLMQLGSAAFSFFSNYLNSLGVRWAFQSGILRLGVAMQTVDFWIAGFLDGRMIWTFGFLFFRFLGFLVFCFFGFLVFWFLGFLVFRFFGFLAENTFLDFRILGFSCFWFSGFSNQFFGEPNQFFGGWIQFLSGPI